MELTRKGNEWTLKDKVPFENKQKKTFSPKNKNLNL